MLYLKHISSFFSKCHFEIRPFALLPTYWTLVTYCKYDFGQFSWYLVDSGSTSIRLMKTAFCEKSPFSSFGSKNGWNFTIFTSSWFFLCFHHHPKQGHYFSDFRHNWNTISWVMTQKVLKLAQFWPINFLIK